MDKVLVVEDIQDFENHAQMEQEDTCLRRVKDYLLEADNRFAADIHFEVDTLQALAVLDMGYFALVAEILPDTFYPIVFIFLYEKLILHLSKVVINAIKWNEKTLSVYVS